MAVDDLTSYGWDEDWASLLAELVAAHSYRQLSPARVVRHHGVAVDVASSNGVASLPLRRGLKQAPVVGDWVAVDDGVLVDVLERRTLLERRSVRSGRRHPLVANIDQVLITCGLDRPLVAGRIQRSATVAWEAGATPVIVLTKADLSPGDVEATVTSVRAEHPGMDVLVTSAVEGIGLDQLREAIGTATVALLGESGSGKSSLVNALCGEAMATTGEVRARDRKGRHTTTTRELYALAGGGVVVDTPGLRALGVYADEESLGATFDDIAELAEGCRFRDCAHDREPGCAVQGAIDGGRLDARRLEAFHRLEQEVTSTREEPR